MFSMFFCIDLIYGYLWERLQPELRVDRSPPRPEGERPVLEGSAALRFLDALFGRMGAAGTGGLLAFRGSFFLLYELFTGTLEVKLFPDDNPGILASVPWAWNLTGLFLLARFWIESSIRVDLVKLVVQQFNMFDMRVWEWLNVKFTCNGPILYSCGFFLTVVALMSCASHPHTHTHSAEKSFCTIMMLIWVSFSLPPSLSLSPLSLSIASLSLSPQSIFAF